MAFEATSPARESAEYAEMIAEVFVETVRKAATTAMSCEYDGEEITPSLMECLQYLLLHGASPVREIACGLEVSVSAASQLVDRLFRKGLVTRGENQEDRRQARVELTEAGELLVRQMRARRFGWFESIVSGMPDSMRRSFLDGLEGFLRVALAGERNIDRACVKCGMTHVPFCVVNELKTERSSSEG